MCRKKRERRRIGRQRITFGAAITRSGDWVNLERAGENEAKTKKMKRAQARILCQVSRLCEDFAQCGKKGDKAKTVLELEEVQGGTQF